MTPKPITTLSKLISIGAAFLAVGLWSLKPIYVSGLRDRYTPEEIFTLAGGIGVIASLLIMLFHSGQTSRLIRHPSAWGIQRLAIISGLCLGLWYWAFYHALSGPVPVQAVIIAFTWPLIGILALRLFAPRLHRSLHRWEYPVLLMAFVGAAVTAQGSGGHGSLMIFAALAALGSGLYLPFAMRALDLAAAVTNSRISASFYVIASANIVALSAGIVLFALSGAKIWPDALPTMRDLILFAMIGLGTYLMAEIIWCWALSLTNNASITATAFFAPVISVMLLTFWLGEPVPMTAWLGLITVLLANLMLHFRVIGQVLRGRGSQITGKEG